MLRETINELRAEAKQLGVPWSWVLELKEELIQLASESRAPRVEARQEAWFCYVGRKSGSAPFWRHGFQSRFGRRLAQGSDYTIIPCYDEIADAVRQMAEEYSAWDSAEIWDFLLSDYEPWPPREHFYWEALHQIAASQQRPATTCTEDF